MPNSIKCKIKHLCHNGTLTERERDRILKALEQEPCEDCISRQAAIDTIESWLVCDDYNEAERHIMRAMQSVLYDLPPVKLQEPKTGHWIKVTNGRGGHECDLCHEYAPSYQSGKEYLTNYCPNCGAKMIEPQERIGKE